VQTQQTDRHNLHHTAWMIDRYLGRVRTVTNCGQLEGPKLAVRAEPEEGANSVKLHGATIVYPFPHSSFATSIASIHPSLPCFFPLNSSPLLPFTPPSNHRKNGIREPRLRRYLHLTRYINYHPTNPTQTSPNTPVSARALPAPIVTATADFVALRLPLPVMTGTSPNTPTIHLQHVIDNQSSTAQQIREDEEEAANPGSNLFVTGIHPRLTEEEVRRLFEKYGDVETCSIMRDPHTRESRGFGFVNMVTGEQADAAKSGLQGEVYEGRTLSIEKARRSRPRTPTPGKYFGPPKRSKQSHPQHVRSSTDFISSRRSPSSWSLRWWW